MQIKFEIQRVTNSVNLKALELLLATARRRRVACFLCRHPKLSILIALTRKDPLMNGKTGDRVVLPGIYKCKDHPEVTKTFTKGTVFLPCSRAGSHGTVWILVRKIP